MGGSVGGMPQQSAGQGAPSAPSAQAGNPQQQLGQLPQWLGQLGAGQQLVAGQAPVGGQMSAGNLIQALMQSQMQPGSAWGSTPAPQPTGNNMFSQLFARR